MYWGMNEMKSNQIKWHNQKNLCLVVNWDRPCGDTDNDQYYLLVSTINVPMHESRSRLPTCVQTSTQMCVLYELSRTEADTQNLCVSKVPQGQHDGLFPSLASENWGCTYSCKLHIFSFWIYTGRFGFGLGIYTSPKEVRVVNLYREVRVITNIVKVLLQ